MLVALDKMAFLLWFFIKIALPYKYRKISKLFTDSNFQMTSLIALTDIPNLLSRRFFNNFLPIPASNSFQLGNLTPDFQLPDITSNRLVKLSNYQSKQPVLLAFTRIFTAKTYCPLCYPHIKELNENYHLFQQRGIEILLISSTDEEQSKIVVADLGLRIPLLSDPQCHTFNKYCVGQALGAPLPAQFILDDRGKLIYKHLFSFIDNNAGVDKLLQQL